MAESTTNPILKVIATTSDRVKELPIESGQLVFIQDKCRIAFDFNGNRKFYNQITELDTEQERSTMDAPKFGYYFIIDTATLWLYRDGWVQITDKPEEVVFIGTELPELGVEKKLYVDRKKREISVWDDTLKDYDVVANKTESIEVDVIKELFNLAI